MIKDSKNKIIGITILIVNIIWTGDWIWLFYGYHFTGNLWLFMYPDWILITNMILGIVGIIIGINLIKNKFGIKKALIMDIPLLIIGFLISFIIPM
ncbi:hypothetical protein BZG01_10610 [Labilibaculum manganireducens]|uniref:Uncharacterized protein n=1 Tax=Labilibaculum manganireducens TaxID=1940525 RepID=A0A2N3I812_9BACT|nr:hypothetical protein [Labilibaculum manganireducens]PKQ66472.1 hypothetical protein BZG01_10610 [Labilibaculum manganireducens]